MYRKIRGFIAAFLIVAAAAFMAAPSCVCAEEEAAPEEPVVTIGISITATNTTFGQRCKALLDAAAASLDVKLQYADHGDDPEKILVAAEHLAAYAGCSGIVQVSPAVYDFAALENICDKYDAYFASAFDPMDPEDDSSNAKAGQKSSRFVGASYVASGGFLQGTGGSGYEFCCPLYSFFMVYRAVTGAEVPEKGSFVRAEVPLAPEMTGADLVNYRRYFEFRLPYSADELSAMAALTDAEIAEAAAKLSVEDAAIRSQH